MRFDLTLVIIISQYFFIISIIDWSLILFSVFYSNIGNKSFNRILTGVNRVVINWRRLFVWSLVFIELYVSLCFMFNCISIFIHYIRHLQCSVTLGNVEVLRRRLTFNQLSERRLDQRLIRCSLLVRCSISSVVNGIWDDWYFFNDRLSTGS